MTKGKKDENEADKMLNFCEKRFNILC